MGSLSRAEVLLGCQPFYSVQCPETSVNPLHRGRQEGLHVHHPLGFSLCRDALCDRTCATGLFSRNRLRSVGCIQNKNQMVPYFVIHTLSFLLGLSGLYIATISSGSLSTFSSGINSLAANTVKDFLAWVLQHRFEFVVTTKTKILVCLFGMTSTEQAYLAKDFQGPVIQAGYTLISATNGPLLCLFLLGALFP